MKYSLVFLLFFLLLPAPVQAADLISPRPYCGTFRNDTPNYILGSVRTAYGTSKTGEKGRHESSFRLESGEKKEVCATGPFYPGYQVEFVIKTMIPVFSCKTALKGTIVITSKHDKNDFNKYYATCVPPLLIP